MKLPKESAEPENLLRVSEKHSLLSTQKKTPLVFTERRPLCLPSGMPSACALAFHLFGINRQRFCELERHRSFRTKFDVLVSGRPSDGCARRRAYRSANQRTFSTGRRCAN